MIRPSTRSAALMAALAFTFTAVTSFAAPGDEVSKPVKTLIGSIRQERDLNALKLLAGEDQGRVLLGDQWEKATPEQKKEFITLFHSLFGKIAFPKVRENFQHLDTILYQKPEVTGARAELASTIVIDHPVKKQELKLKYQLVNQKGWKVMDVAVLGDSMLEDIRDDQVTPIMKEGGWPLLLDLMRKKDAELKNKMK